MANRSTQAIVAQVFRDTLLAEASIVSLVGQKIAWKSVEQNTALPYITMHHISGGDENCTQERYVDTIWKIIGETADKAQSLALTNAIYKALADVMPVSHADAAGYTTIEEKLPVNDDYLIQNTRYYAAGGMYRLRLQLL